MRVVSEPELALAITLEQQRPASEDLFDASNQARLVHLHYRLRGNVELVLRDVVDCGVLFFLGDEFLQDSKKQED